MILILALSAILAGDGAENLIVPGECVGPVCLTMDREDLADALGEECLRDFQVQMGEGFTSEGTVVWEGSERELVVVWNDQSLPAISEIKVTGPYWVTEEGLHTGMTLVEVDSLIGEFHLLGFAWDYEGYADLTDTSMEPGISMRFNAPDLDDEACWTAMEAVMGDRLFSSRDRDMIAFNPLVETIRVHEVYQDI